MSDVVLRIGVRTAKMMRAQLVESRFFAQGDDLVQLGLLIRTLDEAIREAETQHIEVKVLSVEPLEKTDERR